MMKKLRIKILRLFTCPSKAYVRRELRNDAKRMIIGNWFTEGVRGH